MADNFIKTLRKERAAPSPASPPPTPELPGKDQREPEASGRSFIATMRAQRPPTAPEPDTGRGAGASWGAQWADRDRGDDAPTWDTYKRHAKEKQDEAAQRKMYADVGQEYPKTMRLMKQPVQTAKDITKASVEGGKSFVEKPWETAEGAAEVFMESGMKPTWRQAYIAKHPEAADPNPWRHPIKYAKSITGNAKAPPIGFRPERMGEDPLGYARDTATESMARYMGTAGAMHLAFVPHLIMKSLDATSKAVFNQGFAEAFGGLSERDASNIGLREIVDQQRRGEPVSREEIDAVIARIKTANANNDAVSREGKLALNELGVWPVTPEGKFDTEGVFKEGKYPIGLPAFIGHAMNNLATNPASALVEDPFTTIAGIHTAQHAAGGLSARVVRPAEQLLRERRENERSDKLAAEARRSLDELTSTPQPDLKNKIRLTLPNFKIDRSPQEQLEYGVASGGPFDPFVGIGRANRRSIKDKHKDTDPYPETEDGKSHLDRREERIEWYDRHKEELDGARENTTHKNHPSGWKEKIRLDEIRKRREAQQNSDKPVVYTVLTAAEAEEFGRTKVLPRSPDSRSSVHSEVALDIAARVGDGAVVVSAGVSRKHLVPTGRRGSETFRLSRDVLVDKSQSFDPASLRSRGVVSEGFDPGGSKPGTVEGALAGFGRGLEHTASMSPLSLAVKGATKLLRKSKRMDGALTRLDEMVEAQFGEARRNFQYASEVRRLQRNRVNLGYRERAKFDLEVHDYLGGMSEKEHDQFFEHAFGTAADADVPTPAVGRALGWARSYGEGALKEALSNGNITPEVAWVRRYQALRIARFGAEQEASLQARRMKERAYGRDITAEDYDALTLYQKLQSGVRKQVRQLLDMDNEDPAFMERHELSEGGQSWKRQMIESYKAEMMTEGIGATTDPAETIFHATAALTDLVAGAWAKEHGKSIEDYYRENYYGAAAGWGGQGGEETLYKAEETRPIGKINKVRPRRAKPIGGVKVPVGEDGKRALDGASAVVPGYYSRLLEATRNIPAKDLAAGAVFEAHSHLSPLDTEKAKRALQKRGQEYSQVEYKGAAVDQFLDSYKNAERVFKRVDDLLAEALQWAKDQGGGLATDPHVAISTLVRGMLSIEEAADKAQPGSLGRKVAENGLDYVAPNLMPERGSSYYLEKTSNQPGFSKLLELKEALALGQLYSSLYGEFWGAKHKKLPERTTEFGIRPGLDLNTNGEAVFSFPRPDPPVIADLDLWIDHNSPRLTDYYLTEHFGGGGGDADEGQAPETTPPDSYDLLTDMWRKGLVSAETIYAARAKGPVEGPSEQKKKAFSDKVTEVRVRTEERLAKGLTSFINRSGDEPLVEFSGLIHGEFQRFLASWTQEFNPTQQNHPSWIGDYYSKSLRMLQEAGAHIRERNLYGSEIVRPASPNELHEDMRWPDNADFARGVAALINRDISELGGAIFYRLHTMESPESYNPARFIETTDGHAMPAEDGFYFKGAFLHFLGGGSLREYAESWYAEAKAVDALYYRTGRTGRTGHTASEADLAKQVKQTNRVFVYSEGGDPYPGTGSDLGVQYNLAGGANYAIRGSNYRQHLSVATDAMWLDAFEKALSKGSKFTDLAAMSGESGVHRAPGLSSVTDPAHGEALFRLGMFAAHKRIDSGHWGSYGEAFMSHGRYTVAFNRAGRALTLIQEMQADPHQGGDGEPQSAENMKSVFEAKIKAEEGILSLAAEGLELAGSVEDPTLLAVIGKENIAAMKNGSWTGFGTAPVEDSYRFDRDVGYRLQVIADHLAAEELASSAPVPANQPTDADYHRAIAEEAYSRGVEELTWAQADQVRSDLWDRHYEQRELVRDLERQYYNKLKGVTDRLRTEVAEKYGASVRELMTKMSRIDARLVGFERESSNTNIVERLQAPYSPWAKDRAYEDHQIYRALLHAATMGTHSIALVPGVMQAHRNRHLMKDIRFIGIRSEADGISIVSAGPDRTNMGTGFEPGGNTSKDITLEKLTRMIDHPDETPGTPFLLQEEHASAKEFVKQASRVWEDESGRTPEERLSAFEGSLHERYGDQWEERIHPRTDAVEKRGDPHPVDVLEKMVAGLGRMPEDRRNDMISRERAKLERKYGRPWSEIESMPREPDKRLAADEELWAPRSGDDGVKLFWLRRQAEAFKRVAPALVAGKEKAGAIAKHILDVFAERQSRPDYTPGGTHVVELSQPIRFFGGAGSKDYYDKQMANRLLKLTKRTLIENGAPSEAVEALRFEMEDVNVTPVEYSSKNNNDHISKPTSRLTTRQPDMPVLDAIKSGRGRLYNGGGGGWDWGNRYFANYNDQVDDASSWLGDRPHVKTISDLIAEMEADPVIAANIERGAPVSDFYHPHGFFRLFDGLIRVEPVEPREEKGERSTVFAPIPTIHWGADLSKYLTRAPLFQRRKHTVKGAVEFLNDGRAIHRIMLATDATTLVHESGHLFRRYLPPRLLAKAEVLFGVKPGEPWSIPQEEQFAESWEAYMAAGKSPDRAAAELFQKFSGWLGAVYTGYSAENGIGGVSPPMRRLFAEILGFDPDNEVVGDQGHTPFDAPFSFEGGHRIAVRARERFDMTVEEAAGRTGIEPDALRQFEETGEGLAPEHISRLSTTYGMAAEGLSEAMKEDPYIERPKTLAESRTTTMSEEGKAYWDEWGELGKPDAPRPERTLNDRVIRYYEEWVINTKTDQWSPEDWHWVIDDYNKASDFEVGGMMKDVSPVEPEATRRLEQGDSHAADYAKNLPPGARKDLATATARLSDELRLKGRAAPFYLPMLKKIRPSDFLMPSSFLRRPKNSQFKHSSGKLYASNSFIKNPTEIYRRWNNSRLKLQTFLDVMKDITNSPRIPKRIWDGKESIDETKEALLPIDALSRAVVAQMLFEKGLVESIDRVGMVDDAVAEALRPMVAQQQFEATAKVGEGRVWVVPKAVKDALRSEYSGAPKWVRTLIDQPTKRWIVPTLFLRPAWIVNNVVSNTMVALLSGTMPKDFIRAVQEQYVARTPEDFKVTTMNQQAILQAPHMGSAANSYMGRFWEWLDSTKPARALQTTADYARAFNSGVEEWYRRATYLNQAEKLTRKAYVKRTGDSFFRAFDLLRELDTMSPGQVEQVVKQVNYWMGEFDSLMPFERHVVRRLAPFYSFLRYQIQMVAAMPVNHPVRALMLAGIAKAGQDASDDDERKLPEYMRNRGLVHTGTSVVVNGRILRVYLSTQGWNPFVMGGLSEAGEVKDLGDLSKLMQGQLSPVASYPIAAVSRTTSFGSAFTEPGTVLLDGRYYRKIGDLRGYRGSVKKVYSSAGVVEVEPPIPNPLEYYAGSFPQTQLAVRMINPRAGYSAEPFSVENARRPDAATERTRLTELLRYFTGGSFVLVDESKTQAYPLSRSTMRSLIRKMSEQESMRRQK